MKMSNYHHLLVVILAGTLSACGDSKTAGQAKSAEPIQIYTPEAKPSQFGVGPVQEDVALADLDPALATEGEQVFTTNCTACHKLDKRHVGPALGGVTKRRNPAWIMNMMLNPENMVKEDPIAKQLLGEYMAPMANQNLSKDQARAVLEYFRKYDEEHP